MSAGAAYAAPLAGSPGSIPAAGAGTSSSVQLADYRRCWIGGDGVRRCRWYADPDYGGYDDGYYDYGPTFGYGPGFFFGGGRGHGHFRGGHGGGGGGHFRGGGGHFGGGGGHGGGHGGGGHR